MADLSGLYGALQAADAAGNTADAQQLADYIRGQSAPASDSPLSAQQSGPVDMDAPLKNNPLSGMNFGQNVLYGDKQFVDNATTAAKEWWGRLTGNQSLLQSQRAKTASDRALYQPVSSSVGGKVGQAAIPLLTAGIPGANTWAGAAAIGGLLGAAQPTAEGERAWVAPAAGAGLGLLGKGAGDLVKSWLTERAAQPLMGWNPGTANRVATAAIGSDAPKLTQDVAAEATQRTGQIFNQARSPNVSVPVGDSTLNALDQVGTSLNTSSRKALIADDNVKDLISHLGGSPTAEQLGSISSNLGKAAKSQMSGQAGDRQLGRALFAVQDHVDDLIGSSITDPALASAYQTARQQYRALQQITANSSNWNSATGDVYMTALGKFLQRTDKPGYARGGNQSDLYSAARWGQASGGGKGMPEFDLAKLGLPTLKYMALNNPATRLGGGLLSRAGAPIAPGIQRGLLGGSFASTPLGWPQGLIQ